MSENTPTNRRGVVSVGLPLLTFVAGVVAQLLSDKFSDKFLTTTDKITLAAVAGLGLLVCVFGFMVASNVRESARSRSTVHAQLDNISKKFGISVQFVPDTENGIGGATYRYTTELIREATDSIVFVDFWLATGNYLSNKPEARDSRDEYYQAILDAIGRQRTRNDGHIFHRRIVQMPELSSDGTPFTLRADSRFAGYLTDCLKLQEDGTTTSLVKVAPPYVHTHFAIIDKRFVVLPILTSHPSKGGLTRHGALIFDDHVGSYVSQLMAIYGRIDSAAHPLEEKHLL